MSTITKKAFNPSQLSATAATIYACPVNTRSTLKKITVSNNDTSARSVTTYIVPAAGTAGTSNIVTVAQTLAAGEARDLYELEGHCLAAADFLQASADVANKVTIHGTVVETTV